MPGEGSQSLPAGEAPACARAACLAVAVAIVGVAAAAWAIWRAKKKAPRREGYGFFDWADWPVASERENFAAGQSPKPCSECAGGSGGVWRRGRDGFSPDRPGACDHLRRRAARIEAAGLGTAAGLR